MITKELVLKVAVKDGFQNPNKGVFFLREVEKTKL